MAKVELVGVSHSYVEGEWALRDIDVTWEDGVASALLGPSGCGKTTLLKIISGLLKPTEGKVLIDGKEVNALSPKERNVAQVFQFPVVYETMNVYDNLAFPLRNRGLEGDVVDERVRRVADMLELTDVLQKRAAGLGAAEKQRISMGRGIVREDTSAVLFDEPLTVIDPHMKWQLRRQLKELHQNLGMTMVYVTHDQHEALTFADQVTVMNDGRAMQTGSPEDLHERPGAPFVGYFIGSPGMNLFEAERTGDTVRFGELEIPLDGVAEDVTDKQGELKVGIRPEFVERVQDGTDDGFAVTAKGYTLTGSAVLVDLEGKGLRFKARFPEGTRIRTGDELRVRFPSNKTLLYVGDDVVDVEPEVRA